MNESEQLLRLCLKGMYDKDLRDEGHKARLKYELKQIGIQEEQEYFLDLHRRKVRFPENEHNLLVAYLLGLANDFAISQEPASAMGEWPDIDIDYLPQMQDYLRDEWAPKHFGRENVCLIGTYGSMGIKSAILDMTKIHGGDKGHIQGITVKMDDVDDEGAPLEWDKALEIYKDLNSFCEANPEIADATKAMLDRNKSAGVHAGGLIICNQRIDTFVPLEVRKVTKDRPEGVIVAAWTEGLRAQDLQPVGLIKFDVLAIINLLQIAYACKLIKERHPEVQSICALPGDKDWSDTSYLNDPASIAMANEADLRGIFQFDSEGIRKLVKRGGVTSFDDIVAYASLYRPGPLNEGMDARYCKRKKGEEEYFLHPLMEPILGNTYGVMVYQEQVMQILHIVGDIPLIHCEKVRKAISKKKVEQFSKYKEQFVINGQKNLRANEDFCESLWKQIEAFAEYGFNKSHATAYSYISARLLWLKAHYPLEFYAATLMCEKDDDKLKDYRIDAERHGVEILPVNINGSGENFRIADGKIYFGFSNLKGIGKAGKEIVENQPYTCFRDFLDKCGTGAKIIKALVSLGVFDEDYDRLTLYKFCECYKDVKKKKKQRLDRYTKSKEKQDNDLRELLLTVTTEDDPDFEKMCQLTDEASELWSRFANVEREVPYNYRGEQRIRVVTVEKQLNDILGKRESTERNFAEKEAEDEDVSIDTFDPTKIKVDKDIEKLLTDSIVHKGKEYYPMAERDYYGFQWVSNVERSPVYKGWTIDKFLEYVEVKQEAYGIIEVEILSVRHRVSKNKKTEFYSVDVEDANGKKMVINVWMDDYIRFKDKWKKGHLLRLEVKPPTGGYRTLTFNAPQKRFRHKVLPKNVDDDLRLYKMPTGDEIKEEPETADLTTLTMDSIGG